MALKEGKDMQYRDVTNKFINKKRYEVKKQKSFTNNNGIEYRVDGRNVILKTSQSEMEVAKLLGEMFGGQVCLIPVVLNPKGVQTPDYMINKEKFDLKKIFGNGKNTLDTAISKKKKQSNNFVFDISQTVMGEEKALEQIQRIYNSRNRSWVDRIILIKDNQVLKVFKRE